MFCGLSAWNKRPWPGQTPELKDDGVFDFNLLNMETLKKYPEAPELAAEEALKKMAYHGIMHSDMKWEHVALWPMYSESTE